PEHIRHMRQALTEFLKTCQGAGGAQEPAGGDRRAIRGVSGRKGDAGLCVEPSVPPEKAAVESPGLLGISSQLSLEPGKSFFVSVELDPPKGAVARKILQAAEKLSKVGADSINVGDSPMARVRMSSMATCLLIQEKVGTQTIIHFTTRDRNLMGIQADILGCQALGIHTILALTGDPPSVGTYAHATAVYDVDSIGLIRIISELNHGVDIAA